MAANEKNAKESPLNDDNRSGVVNERRRAFAKVGTVAPLIMTLSSKTALGAYYQCTLSGALSGNISNEGPISNCAVGYSPTNWKNNANKLAGVGNIDYWLGAGIYPFKVQVKKSGINYTYQYDKISTGESSSSTWVTVTTDPWLGVVKKILKKANGGTLPTTDYLVDATKISAFSSTNYIWLELQANTDFRNNAIAAYLDASLYQNSPVGSQFKTTLAPVFSSLDTGDILILYNLGSSNIGASVLLRSLYI